MGKRMAKAAVDEAYMEQITYIDVQMAARLTGKSERAVRWNIGEGKIEAQCVDGGIGGNGGQSYRIPLSAMPAEAPNA